MKDKLHKPHTSFKKEQKIFDDWRQFLNESAAPGMVALDEQEEGASATSVAGRSMTQRGSLEHQVENYIYESGILKELLK